jgi:adenylate cyclase
MRSRFRQRFRQLLFLGAAVVLLAFSIVLYAVDAFRDTELDLVDARFSVRGELGPPKDIVYVAIDDRTFNELQTRFPFPRSFHGQVIDQLSRDGAQAIAYDVQFTEPTKRSQDTALIGAVDRAISVVLAATEVDERGRSSVFGGEDVVRSVGARTGNARLPNDPGGVIRRLQYDVQGLKSFSIATAEEVEGRRIERGEMPADSAWIDYHGPPGTVKTISFSRVYNGRFPPGTFRGKIVVIGAKAESLQDVKPTSVEGEGLMSGPEIQANAISTVLRDFPLKEGPVALDVVLIALLGMIAPFGAVRLGPARGALLGVASAALFVVGVQLAFNSGLIVSLLYPLIAAGGGLVVALGMAVVIRTFERERVRDLFGRFVPEAVVDDVLAHADEDLRLGGKTRTITVLFSDIRGFTTYSETRPPDEVLDVLNRYLSAMTEVILDHGGTLVSYLGDGIMALFGAPIDQPDHADRAVGAAREMTGPALERFNDWLRSRDSGEGFRMGVGLNTGPAMVGNLGSEARMEYTAIGDVVNTASRLEGMTKGTPHMIFLADSTRAALTRKAQTLVHVADLEVRGKQAHVSVWSVAAARESAVGKE